MALRDKMAESAQQFLEPGEQIEAVIPAQTASQYLAMLGGLIIVFVFLGLNRYRMLVATQKRILVLDTGKFSVKTARGVVAELPRSTKLGPGSGMWHVVVVDGKKLRVHRRFFKDLAAADAAAALS